MILTPHFQLAEFEVTSTGLRNHAPGHAIAMLRCLCSAVLQPLREQIGPIRVTSGYRSRQVNEAVGGSAESWHMFGCAADIVPVRCDRQFAWNALLLMRDSGFPIYEAIVYEATGHIHVAHVPYRLSERRFSAKLASGDYVNWDRYRGPRDWI